MPDGIPFLSLDLSPFSPWTDTSETAAIGPRRPICNEVAYWEVGQFSLQWGGGQDLAVNCVALTLQNGVVRSEFTGAFSYSKPISALGP